MSPPLHRTRGLTTRSRSPVSRLVIGLTIAAVTIAGFSAYTVREIRRLRDEQTALSERNRLDGLQIVRIQQNLATVAATLRDMLDRIEPYPLSAWGNTFARLRLDLDQALARERSLAPTGRPEAESARIEETARRFWGAMDRAFAQAAAGDEAGAALLVRDEATRRHAELASLVSQLLIHNTRVDEEAAARARSIYDRVARDIYLLAAVLIAAIIVGGLLLIRATRRTFEEVAGTGRRAAGAVVADAASAGGSADLVRARAPRRVRADSHGDGHDARARLPPGPGAGSDPRGFPPPAKAPAVRRSARARRRKPRGDGWPIWRRSSRSRSRRSIASAPVHGCCIPSSSTTSASSRRSPGMPTSSRASTASTPSSSPRATSPDCRVKSPRTCIASSRNRSPTSRGTRAPRGRSCGWRATAASSPCASTMTGGAWTPVARLRASGPAGSASPACASAPR